MVKAYKFSSTLIGEGIKNGVTQPDMLRRCQIRMNTVIEPMEIRRSEVPFPAR